MEKDEDIQIVGTTADLIIQMMTDEKEGEEFSRGFLRASFLSSALDALFYARRRAGLTQAQVAEKLNTKQSAVARLEADVEGAMSLRRYVDFALACGMIPLDFMLIPVDTAIQYTRENPEASLTPENYYAWQSHQPETLQVHTVQASEPLRQSLTDNTTVVNEQSAAGWSIEQYLQSPAQNYVGRSNTVTSVASETNTIQHGNKVSQKAAA